MWTEFSPLYTLEYLAETLVEGLDCSTPGRKTYLPSILRIGRGRDSAIHPLMKSARDRYSQLKFLHRAYYTPQKLSKIYPAQSDRCPKCYNQFGTFLHVVWSCPLIQEF